MTTRTVQFWGQGYSTPPGGELTLTPCTITATLNGNTIFSGDIPTIESTDIGRLPSDQVILFTTEIPLDLEGAIPMTMTITGADVYLEQVLANYCNQGNVSYPNTSGATGFDNIAGPSNETRANVTCTGASYVSPPPPVPRPAGQEGTWGWEIENNPGGSAVFSYDLMIQAGTDIVNPPPPLPPA